MAIKKRYALTEISIHAPREGSDHRQWQQCARRGHFYPRSPRGERPGPFRLCRPVILFLSTLPARGATSRPEKAVRLGAFLSTLPARGATWTLCQSAPTVSVFLSTLPARGATALFKNKNVLHCISIHAPREGSDQMHLSKRANGKISIHAPREGSDILQAAFVLVVLHFYPRSPRGERRQLCKYRFRPSNISIHAPREGSDGELYIQHPGPKISIHAPREGSDGQAVASHRDGGYFYPRSPRGERRYGNEQINVVLGISIHAPREGSDDEYKAWLLNPEISIHAPREGSDRP